ncbi:MAG: fatty acid desaturase [Verrucomicrobiales bacterium]|nr:fatty acid desaturase [Verrucomicrobiales bacterium]
MKTPEKQKRNSAQANPKEFIERNTLRGLRAVCRDWLVIAGAISLSIYIEHWAVWVASVWVIGIMQFALAEAVLHEASHYNLFRSRHLHHRLQFLYAWPFMQTMNDYQAEHLAHHKYLMTERDQTSVDYKMYGLAKREPNLFFIWFIKPFTFYPTWHYLRHGNAALDRANWLPLGLFWIAVGGLFVALGQAQYFLLYWIVPLLWVYPILNYWSEIEEHYNTSDGSRSNLSRVINFLTHNEGYHTVHHRYPTIPFYNLPKAHAAFVGDESDISRGFLDTYRQLQAKRPEHV